MGIIGGGPAGSTLAGLLARDGRRVALIERDIHPRHHVGESLVPGNNAMLDRLGFLPKMEDAGFVHKQGVGWTAPRSAPWKFVAIRTSDFPPPDAVQTYSYNVERDLFDLLLLRHAHELGAKVVQGVNAKRVLFDGDRAVGVRVEASEGWEQDLRARFVADASGRRCFLANQLGGKVQDPIYRQFCIWSWFRDVEPVPQGHEGFVFFHFLGLERAWAWQIPLRGGLASMGVVTDKRDFQRSGQAHDAFFGSLVGRNRTLAQAMAGAERVRPWAIDGDYSYRVTNVAGPGWLVIGDAYRFVDPIFSSGIDVALHSASFAHAAITSVLDGTADEHEAMHEYRRKVDAGVDVWYETTDLFYRLQQLFSRFALDPAYRPDIARSLQGNPYDPVNRERSRKLLALMRRAYDEVMADPENLLRPWALAPGEGAGADGEA